MPTRAAASATEPPAATNAARTSACRAVGVPGSEPRRWPSLTEGWLTRAHPAARDKAEDHRGDGEDRADLVRCEVEAERDDQGDHGLDEGEDHRRLAAPDGAGLSVHDVARHVTRTMSPGWISPGLARYLARTAKLPVSWMPRVRELARRGVT